MGIRHMKIDLEGSVFTRFVVFWSLGRFQAFLSVSGRFVIFWSTIVAAKRPDSSSWSTRTTKSRIRVASRSVDQKLKRPSLMFRFSEVNFQSLVMVSPDFVGHCSHEFLILAVNNFVQNHKSPRA